MIGRVCRRCCERMLASSPAMINLNRRLSTAAPRTLPCGAAAALCNRSQRLSRVPLLARGLPSDDLDSLLITRRALSSLEQPPRSHPLPRADSDASSSTGDGSSSGSVSDADTSGLSVEEVLEHKKAAVQQAFLNGSLGFGFSAGGLIFPYYVGLVSSLVTAGVLSVPSQLAGSSAGSLIAASFNAGLDMSTVERSMIEFGEDCLKHGTRYRLGPLLQDFLQQYLPPDAHERCSGNTHVAVTRLLPFWQTRMVSHFDSREDLISALMTSCHIPWYFDGRWMTKFRGHYCVDGGVMAFIPTVPGADYTVKVMCFPSSHLEGLKRSARSSRRLKRLHDLLDIDITMDRFEHWPYDLQQILKWALVASAQETSSLLIEKGKRDAAAWVEAMELAPLVQQQQQQGAAAGSSASARQQQESVVLGGSSSSSEPAAAAAAAGWSDHRDEVERQQEARRAHEAAAEAEAAAAAAAPGSSDEAGRQGLGDVAAAAGVAPAVVDHAEDAAELAGHAPKRRRLEEAAGTAAAAAGEVGGGLARGLRAAVTGEQGEGEQERGQAGDRQGQGS